MQLKCTPTPTALKSLKSKSLILYRQSFAEYFWAVSVLPVAYSSQRDLKIEDWEEILNKSNDAELSQTGSQFVLYDSKHSSEQKDINMF